MFRKPKAQPLFFLARQAGLAYLQVPKAACTSFKVALALLNRPELREEIMERPTRIHGRPEWNDMVQANDRALAGLFRFTFVRHPIPRFISFYQNKILQPPRGSVLPEIAACGFTMGMPLSAVLDIVEKTAPHRLDPHIAPQSWFVFDAKKARVDFIGHIERMSEDIERLIARCGVPLDLGHHNRSPSKEAPELTPSAEDRERIARFYEEDFELLGYTPEAEAPAVRTM